MGVVPSKINSDHCSAPTRQAQQHGRQRVKRVLRLQRMANRPTSDSALPKKVQCRSLCVTPNGSSTNLCQLETRPGCYLHRCNDPRLVPSKRICLSTVQSDRTSTEKVSQDKADLVLVAPVWQAQPWWPALLNLLIQNPVMIPNFKHLLRNPASPLRMHPMYPRLHLAVFHLSGNSTRQKGFQRTLPEYSNQQLKPPQIII